MVRIFISAGEPSGVAIGAMLMRELKKRIPDVTFKGFGGPPMVDEGLEVIFDPAKTAAMWLFGNLKRIPEHRRALKTAQQSWRDEPPDLVITIDYQAFHLYLGTFARKMGLKVMHFVGSQFWGRKIYTLNPIRRAYSHVLLIHEFEKKHYDAAGIPSTFVGHPLFERIQMRNLEPDKVATMKSHPGPRIAVLPGSRGGEISHSLPIMLGSVRRLQPRPYMLLSCARQESRAYLEDALANSDLEGELYDYDSGEILLAADLAVMTSGSITMEAVYYGCPGVVVYRVHPFSYFFARPLVAGYIAQPNIIAGREIVPEFLLGHDDIDGVGGALQHLLTSESSRDLQKAEFKKLKDHLLDAPTPTKEAARVAVELIGENGAGT
ncbi:MAG: lipid-A-disaccharide synthase [Planctomycetota bacterium]